MSKLAAIYICHGRAVTELHICGRPYLAEAPPIGVHDFNSRRTSFQMISAQLITISSVAFRYKALRSRFEMALYARREKVESFSLCHRYIDFYYFISFQTAAAHVMIYGATHYVDIYSLRPSTFNIERPRDGMCSLDRRHVKSS